MLLVVPRAYADTPDWSVNPAAYAATMTLVIEVAAPDVQTPGDDRLAVFVNDPVSGLAMVRGVATAMVTRGQVRYFLTVYANTNGETLTLKYYSTTTDQVYLVDETLTFVANNTVGSVNAPLRMTATEPERGVPAWQVDVAAFGASMTAVARLTVEGIPATSQDALAAFVGDEVRGVATSVEVGGMALFFLTAYANVTTDTLTFKLYDASRDEVVPVGEYMAFAPNANYGSTASPLVWAASLLEAPTLRAPQDGALATSATLDLSWTPTAGGIGYDVQVATDASFSDLVFEDRVHDASATLPVLPYSTRYHWRVRALGDGLVGLWSAPFQFETATGVGTQAVPQAPLFELSAPYPNPAREATTVVYRLAQSAEVTLVVFDLLGRVVQTHATSAHATGQHERQVDVSGLAPGRYVVQVRAGARQKSQLLSVY
ncbi:MAG: T9SS type A sorting domain-containing protein [Bacteroidota bacterium]